MLRRNTGDYMVLHQYDSPPLSVCIWTVYAIIFQRKLGIPKKTSRRRALPIWSKFFGNFGSAVNGESFVALSPWKIPGKSGKSEKVGPFSRLERSERNFMFHFQLLPTRQPSWCPIGQRARHRSGVYDQTEQLFTYRKIHFCSLHRNFRIFSLNGKHPTFYHQNSM